MSLGGLFPTFRKLIVPSPSELGTLFWTFDPEYESLESSAQNMYTELHTLQS
jgi:hypothetical protein